MLRLEHVFDRLGQLLSRETPLDHHYALATLFEIMEVASRADLKSDLLKDLERHKNALSAYRGNPAISEEALDYMLGTIEHAYTGLHQLTGKAGHSLTTNEWLMSIRSRINIPGGTCEFDLPAYFAWQQLPPHRRRTNITHWASSLMPVAEALKVLLSLMRDTGVPHKVVAPSGHFQQSLPAGRTYSLMRLRLPDLYTGHVPEISGHRLMVSVRFMVAEPDNRLKASLDDVNFELTLCC